MMQWTGVVIHHSASADVPAAEIDRWHRARGFAQIGYHWVIRANGAIEPGRPWTQQGAHAATPAPSRNRTHLGICLTGHFGRHPPADEQITSLIALLRGIRGHWGINRLDLHHDECPGALFPWGRLAALGFHVPRR